MSEFTLCLTEQPLLDARDNLLADGLDLVMIHHGERLKVIRERRDDGPERGDTSLLEVCLQLRRLRDIRDDEVRQGRDGETGDIFRGQR